MDPLKKEIQAKWDSHTGEYDHAHAHGIDDPEEEARWAAVFQGRAPATLLDVGCGTGFITLIAAKSGLTVTGVDWAWGMMRYAKEKAEKADLPIKFVLGETEELPFEDGTFDYLSARHVMWTLTEPVVAFRQWARVLRPGGTAFADYSPHPMPTVQQHYRVEVEQQLPLNREVAPEDVKDMFLQAGFSEVQIQEMGSPYGHPRFLFICKK